MRIMKQIKRLSRNKQIIITIIAILVIFIIFQMWNIPRVSLAATIEPIEIIGPVYRGEFGALDQFYISYEFTNPGRVTVEITDLTSTVLLNGTNYNSQQVTHDLANIEPGTKGEIIRVVQLSLAPISNTEGQKWNITVLSEITATSKYLLFENTRTFTDVKSIDWEVHIFE
jgi:hypothetical protein